MNQTAENKRQQPDKRGKRVGGKCFMGPPSFLSSLFFFWLNTQGFLWDAAFYITRELV